MGKSETRYLTPHGWLTSADIIRNAMREIGKAIDCKGHCKERCVFPDVGKEAGCPLLEFEDRCLEAIGVVE